MKIIAKTKDKEFVAKVYDTPSGSGLCSAGGHWFSSQLFGWESAGNRRRRERHLLEVHVKNEKGKVYVGEMVRQQDGLYYAESWVEYPSFNEARDSLLI